jgi:TetR/AcrR family fatty acid metabolism transcriptional regulator
MAYSRTEKTIAKQQARRRKIIRAAIEIFSDDNPRNTSIKAIAQKAGIATGTLYLYFADKEALMDTVVKEMYTELLSIIKKERSRHSDVFEKLQASMEVCLQTFMKEKRFAKILLKYYPEISSPFNTKFTDLENDLIRFVKEDLDELREQGLIPAQDTQVSATAFVGTFRQVVLSWIDHEEPADPEQAYRTLIDYNLRGLGKR